ncbi:MAG: hypothetical protein HOI23_10065 [Deltaproteobacteria bacterium]|nr:hypothetical protein [Deltaproteobacteria bacterium]
MADKVGGGSNVRDLIRKFEDGTAHTDDGSADGKASDKGRDTIEDGLVARRVAELEKKPAETPPQNLNKDDFSELAAKTDGFVRDMAARWAGKAKPQTMRSPADGLEQPNTDRPTGRAHANDLAKVPEELNRSLLTVGAAQDVEITPAFDPTMSGFSYSITKLPTDLNAERVEFQIETGGKKYNLAGAGPLTKDDIERIAESSARTCFLLTQTGVETFKAATLRTGGSLHVDHPVLNEDGTLARQARKLGVEGQLTSFDLEKDGQIDFGTGEKRYHASATESLLSQESFVDSDGGLSNLGDALVGFVKAAFEQENVDQGSGRKVPWPSVKDIIGTKDSENVAKDVVAAMTPRGIPESSNEDITIKPGSDVKPEGVAGALSSDSTLKTDNRTISDVFDFAEAKVRKKREQPGYIGSILRGTDYQPVFSKGDNWFKKAGAGVGNWITKILQKAGSDLVHKKIEGKKSIPISAEEGRTIGLEFSISGQKTRERDIPDNDPRLLAIEKYRAEYPGGLPVWVKGELGEKFGVDLGHSIPLGATGLMANFGFEANQSLTFGMERLVYFESPSMDAVKRVDDQAKRLMRMPLKAENFEKMEEGASFSIKGDANIRLDAALGLGVSVPALNNVPPLSKLVNVGASVEAGAFVAMGGAFNMSVTNHGDGKARLVIGNDKSVEAGIHLKAFAGAEVEQEVLVNILRGFVDYVADGGDPSAFESQLENDAEKALASSMSGYMRLLNKNLAEGVGTGAMNHLVTQYGSAAFEARKGIKLKKDFDTNLDFNFNATNIVTLPRADMVPEELRNDRKPGQPLKIEAGKVSRLAYNMAIRGDLRLCQQLALVRASGVRVNEEVTASERVVSDSIELRLPFVEFARRRSVGSKTIDAYTPELGRTKTAIESFDYEYKGLFGDVEVSGHDLRVHTPKGKSQEALFFGSDENFSADFVVENLTEKWTNHDEMQNYMGILDALSEGQLADRCREALEQGDFRDVPDDSIGLIDRLFNVPKEYGRTTAHLHVWLGEKGLRSLLDDDTHEDDLYMAIGEIFTNLSGESKETMPEWALPGADRSIERRGERIDVSGGPALMYDFHKAERSLKTARYLVDNIKSLRGKMQAADTPEKEKVVAQDIRDFLGDCKDRMSAYAALAMLVPVEQRAVEMRLTALREDETPIRFTYIQDGRSSELLYATGFAQMAMAQLKRYGVALDSETRLRIGNLLGKVRGELNSPSPDLFVIDRSMRVLRQELALMDETAPKLMGVIESDIGMARAYMDSIPSVETIESVLPGPLGTELSILRMTTERELNKSNPDMTLLRGKFKNIFDKMPIYRNLQAADSIIDSTAMLANKLAASEPELAQSAVEAVNQFRKAMEADELDDKAIQKAVENITSVNRVLVGELEDEVQAKGEIAALEVIEKSKSSVSVGGDPSIDRDLAAAREAEGIKYKTLAGSASTAAVSYFERTGAVPKTFIGTARKSLGEGVVTASMVREAELAMANSAPTGRLDIPTLPNAKVNDMIRLLRDGNASGFVELADALRFRQPVSFDVPKVMVLDSLLAGIATADREAFLEKVPSNRKAKFKRVFADIDSDRKHGLERTDGKSLKANLLATPSFKQDVDFLKALIKKDPARFSSSLDSLGYNGAFSQLQGKSTSRLEDVFGWMSGDELNEVCSKIDSKQYARFLELVKSSDLRPQTRARLAGQIVDNNFFWRQEEELVAALVTGMNAGDLRLFFDQLYTDGKLERFLDAGSWWQTLLKVITFGLARLWTHDNEAAMRIVAKQGWSSSELKAQYNSHVPFVDRIEKDAENILLDSVLGTVPMDPLVASGCRAVHSIVGNVKYYHYKDIPKAGLKMLEKAAEGAGEALVLRLVDVAKNGGTPAEIKEEYKKFFEGLSPEAVAHQFRTGDVDGTATVLARALRDGAVKKLTSEAKRGRNSFITPELITFLGDSTQSGVMETPPEPEEDGAS